MNYHLTVAGMSYSTGPTEDTPTAGWVLSETRPDYAVAPGSWVAAWAAAEGIDHIGDETTRGAIRAWVDWVTDERVVAAIGVDETARGDLQSILWTERGIYGQDASVVIEATIRAVVCQRSRLGHYAPALTHSVSS